MLPNALSQYTDLVISATVDSELLLLILTLQETATGESWLQLKQSVDCEERGFCI